MHLSLHDFAKSRRKYSISNLYPVLKSVWGGGAKQVSDLRLSHFVAPLPCIMNERSLSIFIIPKYDTFSELPQFQITRVYSCNRLLCADKHICHVIHTNISCPSEAVMTPEYKSSMAIRHIDTVLENIYR